MIGEEERFVSINASTEVDLVGQCASETVGGRSWSSSGGQADFAPGAMYSPHGIRRPAVHRARRHRLADPTHPDTRIDGYDPQEHVDHNVTEHGVADMRSRSISQRATALIAIADPRFRGELTARGRELAL